MYIKLVIALSLFCCVHCDKIKTVNGKTQDVIKNTRSSPNSSETLKNVPELHKDTVPTAKEPATTKPSVVKVKIPVIVKKQHVMQPIPVEKVQEWASQISQKLYDNEKLVVRRELLLKGFSDIKMEHRSGAAIVDKMAKSLEELLGKRIKMAENIMRKAENLAEKSEEPPSTYTYDLSDHLDKVKKKVEGPQGDWAQSADQFTKLENCTQLRKFSLINQTHFGPSAAITLENTSVQVSKEVFLCDKKLLKDLYWSEDLVSAFRQNYAQDSRLDFQYFCSAKGFLRHYPGALWSSMFQLNLSPEGEDEDEDEEEGGPADVYDCRLRPWYVAANGAPRDILIMLDASGSMNNSANEVHAEQFTLALLSALTDDDQVNVLRYNVTVKSPISCFNETLVPANHINSAAMMEAIRMFKLINQTNMTVVLREAVRILRAQYEAKDRPTSCQQAIVLITDSLEYNLTDYMAELDPTRQIRLFVIWLHDVFGLRDNSRENAGWLSCTSDGSFAELITDSDVTEQVMRILRLLERPLVGQRKERIHAYSDLYAHVEDPRRSEYYWQQKENEEQAYRYIKLRLNKKKLLDKKQVYKDSNHQKSLDQHGHYYEGIERDYRLQISVSVPVFESTKSENITIRLFEEKQRKSTRTYPVNRLLGVAGIDIPIEHLKLALPYHELGAGGAFFLADHRGNIILHDNTKPLFDGDILKPGYRTVDILDLEQSAVDHAPRDYSSDWLEFRKAIVVGPPIGNMAMYSKHIFEGGMRMALETRDYYWRRVMDHYTAVVVLPRYNRRHPVPDEAFTQQLAINASRTSEKSDLAVHPDWLYCRHIDQYFDEREFEVRHFIKRRKEEANFQMQQLKHAFSPIKFVPLWEKPYQCNEELIARFCKEAIVTAPWVDSVDNDTEHCADCELGANTAFFASESGLTRWKQYYATSQHAKPPPGSAWPRGPTEAWYKRASATPDTLVIHAPVTPYRKMRNSDARPVALDVQHKWLTAARTLGSPDKGIVGVAGYHFHPLHLEDLLKAITSFPPCQEDDECQPRCDGEDWTCLLVDEGGWIVAGHQTDENNRDEEQPIREHLSRLYPQAMSALLNASVFALHWVHDYQGVCFPPAEDKEPDVTDAAPMMPSILRTLWRSACALLYISREFMTLLTVVSSGRMVSGSGETEAEKLKRRKHLMRNYEREKYEQLYDPAVLVNRTRFAACDRSRPLYELQRNQKAMKALKRPYNGCKWPLVATMVPNTNLLLIAVFKRCEYSGRHVPDPLNNEKVNITNFMAPNITSTKEWQKLMPASKFACWRNRVRLPARPPRTTCYPHNYTFEEGYRQCGPWLPDPDQEEED